jgi:ADP-heptose:LPS heptosyltransferase
MQEDPWGMTSEGYAGPGSSSINLIKNLMPAKFIKNLELILKDGVSALLHFFLQQARKDIPSSAKRILFLRYDRLGDMILSMPILIAMRRRYPQAEIDVLCSPRNFKILEDSGLADNLYVYQKSVSLLIRLIVSLRKNNYDLIINLVTHASFTFGLFARLSGPQSVRIAGQQEQFAYLYNHHVNLPAKNTVPMLQMKYLLCEEMIGKLPERLPVPWVHYGLPIKEKSSKLREEIFSKLKTGASSRLVGLNLSAGMARREWPLDKYEKFLHTAIEKYDRQISGWVVLTNPADPARSARLIEKVMHKKLIALAGQSDFRVIMELLPVFSLIVSPDTAIVHAASATGVPVLGMTIGQSANVWEPYGVPYVIVTAADYYSLADLPVEQVLGGFDRLIKRIQI